MGARQSSPGGGGVGGGTSLTATTTTTTTSSRVRNDSGIVEPGPGNNSNTYFSRLIESGPVSNLNTGFARLIDSGPINNENPGAYLRPSFLDSGPGIRCPVCSKSVIPDDVEFHLVMCLTKPRISYNEDILTEDKGECVICLDDLSQGDTIARLPCLCIYHKCCIDAWFSVNRSCPEHPSD